VEHHSYNLSTTITGDFSVFLNHHSLAGLRLIPPWGVLIRLFVAVAQVSNLSANLIVFIRARETPCVV
jgi:hypothetical protein